MARVIFIPFPETGHLYASFKLARQLKSLGHEITYLGVQDFEAPVRLQQFDFQPLFADAIPKGFLSQQVANAEAEPFEVILAAARKGRRPDELLAELARTVVALRPGVLVIDLLLSSVALLAKRLEVASVLLNTQFYDPWEDARKAADYRLLLDVPELVLCPREFDFPRAVTRANCHYVEAAIDQQRSDGDFPWQRLDPDRPLIYCSLGSQSHLINGGRRALQVVIDAIAARQDWQLILTTGTHLNPVDFGEVAANVALVNRAPQLDVLKRASIMITHGGFNTVKECIFYGVPMIVLPLIRDHPAVAARVVHHGLGLRGNINRLSVETVNAMIDEIAGNPSFRTRCDRMRDCFRRREEAGEAVREVLAQLSRGTGGPASRGTAARLPERFSAR
jgi:UDP:flavonoid glycosyltransferase YjiC (YdhE family)